MLLLGYILVTCRKNIIVILHVTFMLHRRNKTCLLGYNQRLDYDVFFYIKFIFSVLFK